MFRLPFQKISIEKLFDEFDVEIELNEDCLILVGPNGTGKSTILNIVYYIISRQWKKLSELKFGAVSVEMNGEVFTIRREELLALGELGDYDFRVTMARLRADQASLFDDLLVPSNIEGSDKFAADYQLPNYLARKLVTQAQRSLKKYPSLARFAAQMGRVRLPRVLYLPTYRRIERDIKAIFPELDKRIKQAIGDDALLKNRSSEHFLEIISFGMEDVRGLVASALRDAKDFERKRITGLAAEYLGDVITGKYESFQIGQLRTLDLESVNQYISRLQKTEYFSKELESIRVVIQQIVLSRSKPRAREKQIAFFFSKIAAAFDDVDQNMRSIDEFVNVVNSYFDGSKAFSFNETTIDVKLENKNGKEIQLSDLSSGEKQIVSLFAHLYMGVQDDYIVAIDEPELSLSVIWQEKFLPDILNTGKCRFLGAVTHSPFIFKNKLRRHVRDVKALITASA